MLSDSNSPAAALLEKYKSLHTQTSAHIYFPMPYWLVCIELHVHFFVKPWVGQKKKTKTEKRIKLTAESNYLITTSEGLSLCQAETLTWHIATKGGMFFTERVSRVTAVDIRLAGTRCRQHDWNILLKMNIRSAITQSTQVSHYYHGYSMLCQVLILLCSFPYNSGNLVLLARL